MSMEELEQIGDAEEMARRTSRELADMLEELRFGDQPAEVAAAFSNLHIALCLMGYAGALRDLGFKAESPDNEYRLLLTRALCIPK